MVKNKGANKQLTVLMNGIIVGYLEKTKSAGMRFQYEDSWLDRLGARPISLSLPLLGQTYIGDNVYNFFDNLLPDNPQIRARIQTKFHSQTDQPFDLLSNIGRDCVGAIQLLESDARIDQQQMLFEPLSNADIANTLRSYQQAPLGMLDQTEEFRISLAGAQEKSAFLWRDERWNKPLGTTPTSHIFKLPIGYIQQQHIDLSDSCENEWLCSEIAAAFGLPVAKCQIATFEDVKVLVVERFDRKLAKDGHTLLRLPQEDMCQALGLSPNLKYQSDGGPGIERIMRLLLGSNQPAEDRDIFFKAQILFWLIAGIDGHAKNFSLFIEPEGKYRLTPLYDIMSAYPLLENKHLQTKKIKMAMALKGKNNHYHWHTLQRRHFIEMADHANYSTSRAEQLLDVMLEQVESVIATVTEILPNDFPVVIAESIFTGMRNTKHKLSKK